MSDLAPAWVVAGPPGAGKSTVAEALVHELGRAAVLVPMDGFHLGNQVLDADTVAASVRHADLVLRQ